MAKPRVVVIDDQENAIDSIKRVFRGRINVVGAANRADHAMGLAWNLCPHVLLLDIKMEGDCPFAACEEISGCTDTRVLFWSGSTRDDVVFKAAASGASGFVAKGNEPGESLIDIVHHIASGGSYWPRDVRPLQQDGAFAGLFDAQERNILRMIADDISIQDIAKRYGVSNTTVFRIISRLKVKCNVRTRFQLAVAATRLGIINSEMV